MTLWLNDEGAGSQGSEKFSCGSWQRDLQCLSGVHGRRYRKMSSLAPEFAVPYCKVMLLAGNVTRNSPAHRYYGRFRIKPSYGACLDGRERWRVKELAGPPENNRCLHVLDRKPFPAANSAVA